MKWISIKDRFPVDDEEGYWKYDAVLVYSDEDDAPRIGIAYYDKDEGWDIAGGMAAFSDEGFWFLKSDDVTHWMPLPQIPEFND